MGSLPPLTPVLKAAQSADAAVRNQAEAQLKHLQETQHDAFLGALALELAGADKPADSRRLAGLILKNCLDSRAEEKKTTLVQQWTAMPLQSKQQIKQALLHTLSAPDDVSHTVALVVAKVAAIEVPRNEWPELIQALMANMNVQPPNSALRQATLEALGYTCEELGALDEDYLQQEEVNTILTAVVQGMRKEEPDADVRRAAFTALYNALEFAHTNFGNDLERNYIMQIVCEGTLAEQPRVRQASWECLVRVASLYYDKLPAYMTDVFTLTQRTVRGDEEEVALQAIELWCTICEEELDRDGGPGEADSESINHGFIKAALPHLAPLLLEQLTKQEEGTEAEDGAWNLAMASGACLGLCAAVAEDAVVPLVMPYVQANIQKQDGADSWRAREAATFAFGSILEGPGVETLGQLVRSGLGFLLVALRDPNPMVKNTTAWTIGRIFEFVHGRDVQPPLIGQQNLPQIIQALLESIRDAPHVAEKVCYAISQLAAGFDQSASASSSLMSPFFKDVVQALLETAGRPAEMSEQIRLQTQAFEAINDVVQSSAADTVPMVVQLIPLMVGKLNETVHMNATTPEAAEKRSELQGLLCGVVQVIVRKLTESDAAKQGVLQYADAIMDALLNVCACNPASVHQDAMLAVGAMTYACGKGFSKYMERFFPVLELGLKQHQDWQVCQVTVGCLGDVARAIEKDLLPYCDRIMLVLLHNLQSNDVHRNIKPQILSCFGDISLAIGDNFQVYLAHVLQMLQSAMQLSVSQAGSEDEDTQDYNNMLRLGILEAWAGMLNGLTRDKANQFLKPYAPALVEYIESIYNDKAGEDRSVWKASVALLGDLGNSVGGVGVLFTQKPYVQQMLHEACANPGMKDTAAWARSIINKLPTHA